MHQKCWLSLLPVCNFTGIFTQSSWFVWGFFKLIYKSCLESDSAYTALQSMYLSVVRAKHGPWICCQQIPAWNEAGDAPPLCYTEYFP